MGIRGRPVSLIMKVQKISKIIGPPQSKKLATPLLLFKLNNKYRSIHSLFKCKILLLYNSKCTFPYSNREIFLWEFQSFLSPQQNSNISYWYQYWPLSHRNRCFGFGHVIYDFARRLLQTGWTTSSVGRSEVWSGGVRCKAVTSTVKIPQFLAFFLKSVPENPK